MTWLLAIFSSVATAATLTTHVTLTDPSAPKADNSGVVVWLEPLSAKPDAHPASSPTLVHKNKTFIPHVIAIQTGTKVVFPNKDPFFHNAFSNYDGQIFDIPLHAPGTTRDFTFKRPGIVRVFCNIHPTMSAVIVVVDTPYFAVSDAAGNLTLPDAPPGEYRLHVFHERVAPAALKNIERTLTLPGDLPALTLSAAGYLETPHQNKIGKPYPAVIKDQYPDSVR
jgi:plastocyanin